MKPMDRIVHELAAELVARFEPVPGHPDKARQMWVVSVANAEPVAHAQMVDALREAAEEGMRRAEDEASLSRSPIRPQVSVGAIAPQTLLIQIELPHPVRDAANAWIVVPAWVLRCLDATLEVVSVYGIPKQYWLILQ
ncbi:hypothetical protein [Polyangium fumosum]|uniref:Uncharacterized protein n=1 Tax=Polyangium fumosum TaxID=889272 RepID=A0A4U1JAY1_9BACT|nr:hypothetical protein [Polyangium fumosum]TKD06476.1 hypothetical protein E8A74_19875 [Polyangium fumosum]